MPNKCLRRTILVRAHQPQQLFGRAPATSSLRTEYRLHAGIADTQNYHGASSRPPAYSHSETNRHPRHFHRPRIPPAPLLIQPHFAGSVFFRGLSRLTAVKMAGRAVPLRSRYTTRRTPPRRFQYSFTPRSICCSSRGFTRSANKLICLTPNELCRG
jgi:hypothetical protein